MVTDESLFCISEKVASSLFVHYNLTAVRHDMIWGHLTIAPASLGCVGDDLFDNLVHCGVFTVAKFGVNTGDAIIPRLC